MKWNRKDILIFFIHAAVMVLVIILPAVATRIATSDDYEVMDSLFDSMEYFIPLFTFYLINYYWLVPYHYYENKALFWGLNVLLGILFSFGLEMVDDGIFFWEDRHFHAARFAFLFAIDVVTYLLAASCALAVRSIMRLHKVELQLQEVKQQNAEAELVWLKNQLNPHFLFNTLNNISSLVQIDADTAQNSITQLSDLLRYALYETNKPAVALADEVEFMDNFIHLMKLRCNEKVRVETDFQVPDSPVSIAPMLFISTLENAFKHGVSSHEASFIKAALRVEDAQIIFTCENSNFPKKTDGRTVKGVGIENLQRRLQLLYPERSNYTQTLTDGVYRVEIRLNP